MSIKATIRILDGNRWVTGLLLPAVRATATDTQPASPVDDHGGGRSGAMATRMVVRITWFRNDGTVDGYVKLRMAYHDRGDRVEIGRCPVP